MKLLFICGSVEIGKDGVGDYTRRLSGELLRMGHNVQILSLCDFQVAIYALEFQQTEGTAVKVYRIPNATANKQRFIWAQNIINDFRPDWISFQFVPYGFNLKGLPFWLPGFLKKLTGNHRWHIMFHELWLGIDKESSLRHKCIGKLQQLIVKKMIHNWKPYYSTTQNKLYQFFLQSHDIKTDVLPICGNIPVVAIKSKVNDFTQFVLFGTIHPGAPFKDFVTDVIACKNRFKNPIKFVFIGKNGPEITTYISILENLNMYYEVMGIQSEEIISQVLINSTFGISTTPYFQTEKSGVYAAYREHQISTICVSRNWTPTQGQYTIPHITKYEKNNLNLNPMGAEVFDLRSMATQFINSISKI
ncbi:glycosyltransferase family protein [Flavobacterium nackdongense]|uniref:Glycosyltransferase family 1 protein n=1 Tax=Flavobacterium nackdongense TaxID=2547394 RepID=A0A4P6Y9G2_9FLAO|nr:glycosyltransferase [Flavobacterium nackdongense]QBN19606.1 glycosyltransferase family 1 protein [Flavobacterium nackdongense]